MVDRRVGVHVGSHQNVAEECLERSRSLGCDTQHLAPRRIGKAPAGADQDPEQVAGCARIAQRTVRALVGDAEAAAEQRQAVALVGREQDAGEVERVVDEARSEVLGEQRAQEQQVERAAVGDERGVAAELVELQRALAGRRRADDVVVGEADEALDRRAESASADRRSPGARRSGGVLGRSARRRSRGFGRSSARARSSRDRRRPGDPGATRPPITRRANSRLGCAVPRPRAVAPWGAVRSHAPS